MAYRGLAGLSPTRCARVAAFEQGPAKTQAECVIDEVGGKAMTDLKSSPRSYEQSCSLLDQIVGRCVRDPEFSSRVLENPQAALSEYALTDHELDDFLALKAGHSAEAAQVWEAIRARMEEL